MNTSNQFVILTPDVNGEVSHVDHGNIKREITALGLNYKPVIGAYKDILEQSYVVPVKSEADVKALSKLSDGYSQECILYVDSNRAASLVFPDGRWHSVGRWQSVSNAKNLEAYTYDPQTNNYYTCLGGK
jgi:hypothetical protein